jgi:hypothetical protein
MQYPIIDLSRVITNLDSLFSDAILGFAAKAVKQQGHVHFPDVTLMFFQLLDGLTPSRKQVMVFDAKRCDWDSQVLIV